MKRFAAAWRDALAALLWSALPVAIAAAGMSPLLQATVVVNGLLALIWLWSRVRDIPVFAQDATLAAGARLGALFSVRVAFCYVAVCALGALPALLGACVVPLLEATWRQRGRRHAALACLAASMVAAVGLRGTPLTAGLAALAAGLAWSLEDGAARAPVLRACAAERGIFYRLIGGALSLPVVSVVAGEDWLQHTAPHAWDALAWQLAIAAAALLLRWGRGAASATAPRAVALLPGVWLLGLPLTGWPGWPATLTAWLVAALAGLAAYHSQGTNRHVRAQ